MDGELARLLDALRALGYGDETIARVIEVGRELSRLQEANGVEFAAMLDAASGDHVGRVIRGEATKVDTTPHIDALQRGHEYVQVHSHPSERTFSLYDVRILCDAPAVRASAVVASGDWWYLVGVTLGDYPAAFRDVYEAFVREREALLGQYQAYIDADAMTEDEAIIAMDREVWRTIAPRLRLVYHEFRVAGGGR